MGGRAMPYSQRWINENPERFAQGRRDRVMRYRMTDKGKYHNLREVAKRRSIECTLSLEEFLSLLEGLTCHWCDGELPRTRAGLDRVDNDQGYNFGNCVRCCWTCNVMKAQMSEQEFIFKCQQVVAVAQSRGSDGAA